MARFEKKTGDPVPNKYFGIENKKTGPRRSAVTQTEYVKYVLCSLVTLQQHLQQQRQPLYQGSHAGPTSTYKYPRVYGIRSTTV